METEKVVIKKSVLFHVFTFLFSVAVSYVETEIHIVLIIVSNLCKAN